MPDYVLGLDVSHYREGVPLKTAKQQGVRFVICKTSEGTSYTDDQYFNYQADCANKSLPFGGFMYWRFIFDAVEQAEYYNGKLLEHGPVQFPPMVDVERFYNVKEGTSDQPIVSIQANRNHLQIVLDTIENGLDFTPIIYTNWATWRSLFGDWDIWGKYDLWVANWRTSGAPLLPVPATDWILHQWTNTYKVEGYTRGLDADWFNGNEGEFEAQVAAWEILWNPTQPPPPPGNNYQEQIDALNVRVDELSQMVDGIGQTVSQNFTEISLLRGKVAVLEKKIKDAGNALV